MENKTLFFFKQLAKIPRESGHEQQVCDYLCNFAIERNLEFICDNYKNVIIKKKNCEKKPIILQAHTDMVCEKKENTKFNFKTDSINIIEENGYLKAHQTSLGADNGIGVAQILNILDSNIPCNIEAVFTSEEETTMNGAINLDITCLKAKHMINLDGFEDNTIIIESASFYDLLMHCNYKTTSPSNNNYFKIELNGLLGGHSGFDIDKNRGNSAIILANLLLKVDDIKLVNFNGGTKFNVIPSSASCLFATSLSQFEIEKIINNFNKSAYPNLSLKINPSIINNVYTNNDSKQFLNIISNFPHGVYIKHNNIVTTSINLGVVDLENNILKIGMRSSKKKEETTCLNKLKKYSLNNNMNFEILGFQPGFESSKNSTLVNLLKQTSPKEYFKKDPTLKAVHFTVEAGFFKDKIPNLDLVIISPKIENAHSINEQVAINSILATDQWLEIFLNTF
ncbi:MAG: M20/M25/M40 family metallo-hydrolase [Bacilli bacterium]